MFYFISALMAALFRTAAHILNKKLLKNINALTLSTSTSFFICMFYLPIFIVSICQNSVITVNPYAYLALIISALMNVFGLLFLFLGLKQGDMSIAVPIRNLVPIFSLVWGIVFLGEKIKLIIIPATILVVLGTILLHYQKKSFKQLFQKSTIYPLLAALSYSLALIGDKYATGYISVTKYTFLIYSTMFLIFVLLNIFRKSVSKVIAFAKANYKALGIISIIALSGTFFTLQAISMANVTTIAPLLRMEVLFSVIAGGIFFKEKNMAFKITGAILLIAGILMIII